MVRKQILFSIRNSSKIEYSEIVLFSNNKSRIYGYRYANDKKMMVQETPNIILVQAIRLGGGGVSPG